MSTSPAPAPATEPWLSGSHSEVPAAGRAVLHALDHALDDLQKWTAGLADSEIHSQPLGLTPIAVHLRHMARSADRILTYAEGGELTSDQLAALRSEHSGTEPLIALLAEVQSAFASAASRVRALAAANLESARSVGRKRLPTSLGGALIHVADHTQRHVGQVVTTAKVLNSLRDKGRLA